MAKLNLSPTARLVRLNRRLSRIVGLDAAPQRDPVTGTFTAAGRVTAKALRSAWSLAGSGTSPAGRAAFSKILVRARARRGVFPPVK